MAQATTNPERFESRWTEHVNQMHSLRNTLPADEWSRLRDTIEEFEELVEIAAEELEGDA